MFRLAVFVLAVAAAFANPINLALDEEWGNFKLTYAKTYSSGEEMLRRMIWEEHVAMIAKHNMEADRGVHTYWLGMNEYGDMSHDEFVKTMNGYIMTNKPEGATFLPPSNLQLPTAVDWRQHGMVTPVKDQKQCGSCWAFSATGSLEGQHFKKTNGSLVSLSEQNLMDCSRKQGNMGCQGGLMDQAFKYIKENDGIDTEMSYPYKAKNEKCKFKKADVGATDTGFMDIKRDSEMDLMSAVATVGPISVAIDASHPSFQMYKHGVYNEPRCSSTRLDHGVLAVGYGSAMNGQGDYWLVKNSWGMSWGMQGYINMSKDKHNQCGIATQASYPLV